MTVAARGLPRDAEEVPVARAPMPGLRLAFSEGATLLNKHVIVHYAITDRPVTMA